VIENPELAADAVRPIYLTWLIDHGWWRLVGVWQGHPNSEGFELVLSDLLQLHQVRHLALGRLFRLDEPIAASDPAMNAERPTHCIAEVHPFYRILFGKDLDALAQSATLNRNTKAERQIVYIDTALRRQQR
jgi:hypothetical protein